MRASTRSTGSSTIAAASSPRSFTTRWQAQDGSDRYSTEIVVQKFGGVLKLLSSQQNGDGESRGNGGRRKP